MELKHGTLKMLVCIACSRISQMMLLYSLRPEIDVRDLSNVHPYLDKSLTSILGRREYLVSGSFLSYPVLRSLLEI